MPRPDGAPLIVWVTTAISPSPVKGVLHVAAISADGLSVGPVHEETALDWTRPHGFAFFGDAFFGAIVAGSATNPGQIRVQRIAADGTPTSVTDALSNVNATSVAPIACGDSLCLVYHAPFPNTNGEAGSNFLQQRIDATGTGIGNIGILSYDSANAYAWAMPVTLGGDIVTVLGGADDALDVVRFSPTSQPLTLPHVDHALARAGPSLAGYCGARIRPRRGVGIRDEAAKPHRADRVSAGALRPPESRTIFS